MGLGNIIGIFYFQDFFGKIAMTDRWGHRSIDQVHGFGALVYGEVGS